MPAKYDALVIGTGQAGPALAHRLAATGWKTAVVERHKFGGTCVNTGCIPTKTLLASARAAYVARRAADYGVTIGGEVSLDMARVKARKDAISSKSSQGLERSLKTLEHATVYEGHARFIGPHTVVVGNQTLEAERIFINVGARAFVPDLPGLGDVPYLTNSRMMEVDFLPEHLIVIGGSYVGLEFGQMYRRFGSKVTIVEQGPRLISRDDEDVSAAVKEILEAEDIEIRLDAECLSAASRNGQVAVGLECLAGAPETVGSHLLLAVGRRPNTDDLGLDLAGVETNARGYITVDDQLRTSADGIWALGDCNGQGTFTHTSYNDFEIVAANLLDDDPRRVSDRILIYGLFIDPPLGRAGMTEAQVRASGKTALIAKRPMSRIARAIERGETQGFMKILVDADSKLILGAAVLGINGDEIVHSILDIMYAKVPYTVIQRAVHAHPTVTELIPTMLAELKPLE